MIIFDLDGTLANIDHRRYFVEGPATDWDGFFRACIYDEPNEVVIMTLASLAKAGHDIHIWSGRSDIVREQTKSWIALHIHTHLQGLKKPHLVMRRNGDYTPDDELKKKWLDDELRQGEMVELVFDDRDKVVKMWRENNIPCFQVAPGNF